MSKYEKYSWFATAEEQQKQEKQKISKRDSNIYFGALLFIIGVTMFAASLFIFVYAVYTHKWSYILYGILLKVFGTKLIDFHIETTSFLRYRSPTSFKVKDGVLVVGFEDRAVQMYKIEEVKIAIAKKITVKHIIGGVYCKISFHKHKNEIESLF